MHVRVFHLSCVNVTVCERVVANGDEIRWGSPLRPHCERPDALRDEGVRSIYQLAHVFDCRVRSLRLLSGHCPSFMCVCDTNHVGLCENPAAPDRVTPSGGRLNIYTSLHCEDSICPGERTRKTVKSNAFHIIAGSVCL